MTAKKTYLVDTENVGTVWKLLLESITKQDSLILFYTEKSPSISYSDLRYIFDYAEAFEMISCHMGKNGLDFQLVTYLGYLLRTATKSEYIIISNDTGYDSVIKFWKERDKKISRLTKAMIMEKDGNQKTVEPVKKQDAEPPLPIAKRTILQKTKQEQKPKQKQETEQEKELPFMEVGAAEVLAGKNETALDAIKMALGKKNEEADVELIYNIFKSNPLTDLQAIYRNFTRNFGQEQGVKLYKLEKPQLKRIYELMEP